MTGMAPDFKNSRIPQNYIKMSYNTTDHLEGAMWMYIEDPELNKALFDYYEKSGTSPSCKLQRRVNSEQEGNYDRDELISFTLFPDNYKKQNGDPF